ARWHSALLQRMTQAVPSIRPAVISLETYTSLNALRGFRHFFRHAYEVPINYEQLVVNLNLSRTAFKQLEVDLSAFLKQLEA
ncbi:MAG: hypothetical protein AAGF66_21035, partial [Cyanobacteria bacterium P01_H01_bin.119]